MKTVKDYSSDVIYYSQQKREIGEYYPTCLIDTLEGCKYFLEPELDKALAVFYKEADYPKEDLFLYNPISVKDAHLFQRIFLEKVSKTKRKDVYIHLFFENIANYYVAKDIFDWGGEVNLLRESVSEDCLRLLPKAWFIPKSEEDFDWCYLLTKVITFDSIRQIKEDWFQVLITLNILHRPIFSGQFGLSEAELLFFKDESNVLKILDFVQKTLERNIGFNISLNYFVDDGVSQVFYEKYDPTPKNLVYNATPAYEWKGLSFRSEQEVRVAKALDALGVTFGPNTGLRVTEPDRRHTREVDFLVIIDGNVGVLEVDSKQYHNPEKDVIRDSIFKQQGLKFIKRYSYQECLDAQEVAIDFVVSMRSFYGVN